MSVLKSASFAFLAGGLLVAGFIGYSAYNTRADITAFEGRVISTADASTPVKAADFSAELANLPRPVQDYFNFVFPDGIPDATKWIMVEQAGDFRRPQTEGFNPTTARQILATADPDMVFSADTPIAGPIWAIAYDVYIQGRMEMEARLLSAVSVMHETGDDTLNRISLRRWLLESSLNPFALLPGGIVTWEAIDDRHARAIAKAHGYETSMVATFDEEGALVSFHAEEDGDLNTPYHGSGEHVRRGNYSLIDGVRVPMEFEISRMAQGKRHPFWRGKVTRVEFNS